MIPHNSNTDLRTRIQERLSSLTLVSEWWLESCLEKNLVVDPEKYLLGKPMPIEFGQGVLINRGLVFWRLY